MFSKLLRILHSRGQQAYMLKLTQNWRIYEIFYTILLEQKTTKKERVEGARCSIKFDKGDDKRMYKVERITDGGAYIKESLKFHALGLYYLVSWKNNLGVENI